jgi:hypothetical protein
MTEPEILPEIDSKREPGLAGSAEAPHSWDPAGRDVPAAKLDWTECLPFRQVRGMDVVLGAERQPFGAGGAGET